MKSILVSKKNNILTFIDDEDYKKVSGLSWCVVKANGKYYVRNEKENNGKREIIYLHQFILPCPSDKEIDHLNGNSLDNRKENLRICFHKENLYNRKLNKNNKTGIKGVYKDGKKYRAQIKFNGKKECLGYYNSPFEAGCVYDQRALVLFGKFAKTNFQQKLVQVKNGHPI